MTKAKLIYQENVEVYAKYYRSASDDILDYKATIQIKDSGKLPVIMKIKFDGIEPSFAPMPPDEHTFKAKNIIDLFLKIDKWFKKYGYELK